MGKIHIRKIRSEIGRKQAQKKTLEALGLRKMHSAVVHNDNPAIRGMIAAVSHLVEVKELVHD